MPFMYSIYPGGIHKNDCPTYSPYAPDTNCRFCQLKSFEHRRYFIYSYFARKIQKQIIRFLFEKFIERNRLTLLRGITPYSILVKKIYYKYYRKWNKLLLTQNHLLL